jgi:ubiquinol-cytochrome c reductase cytochrome b subunit
LSDGRIIWFRRCRQAAGLDRLDRSALPADGTLEVPGFRILRTEKFQFLVLLRFARAARARQPVGDRHFPHHELQAIGGGGVLLGGWLIRYMHSTGASAFFIVVYLHMFRALLYGSHRKPRELLWIFGCIIFLVLMAEAFMGYVLPWGNMSFWGAQVIVSLFGSLPIIGGGLVEWIRGDYVIADATLNRFFALHVAALPLALVFLVIAHLMALHEVGSNNPDGIDIKKKKDSAGHYLDGIPFHPYYTVKDVVGVAGFLLIFCGIIFFAPTFGGLFLEGPNFEPANPLQTPPHIAPVWYFTPFYAMLRAVPSFAGTQVWGVLVMGAAIVVLFFVPWLDRSPVLSIRYRGPLYKIALAIFSVAFIILGICGLKPPSGIYPLLAKICTALYFAFFLLMPWYTKIDSVKPVPERVTGHA